MVQCCYRSDDRCTIGISQEQLCFLLFISYM